MAIETDGLTKRYDGRAVVDGLSIRVPRGQVVGFVGPNGAGKTTTIRMLLGLVRPDGGEARVLGASIRDPAAYLPRVGALIEAPAFYPHLSGAANLRVLCRLGGFPDEHMGLLLAQVGLSESAHRAYKGYSLGMKQRLGIAASLLPDPDLVILDEPTNGLDPAGIQEVRDFLRGLARQGKTVFVSSHQLAEVQRICDHVVVLHQGRVLFQGTMAQLLARGTGLRMAADDPRRNAELAALVRKAGHAVTEGPDGLQVEGVGPREAAQLNALAFKAGIVLRELHAGGTDLEQAFLTMTGNSGGEGASGGAGGGDGSLGRASA
jgi:ABC-2 type transport system ATP-binding protein